MGDGRAPILIAKIVTDLSVLANYAIMGSVPCPAATVARADGARTVPVFTYS